MKVHEIAKQIGVPSKDILAFLSDKGQTVKSHMSKLSTDQIVLVEQNFSKEKGVVTTASESDALKSKTKKTVKKKPVGTKKQSSKKAKENNNKAAPSPDVSDQDAISDEISLSDSDKDNYAIREEDFEIEKNKRSIRKSRGKEEPKKIIKDTPARERALRKEHVQRPEHLHLKLPITVSSLAANLCVKTSELIKALMSMGVFATVNQQLGEDIVMKVAEKFGVLVEKLPDEEQQLIIEHDKADDDAALESRPPVVTMMGHVDHGKTSLLDAIRKSNVADREAGKITQHIGAYSVNLKDKGTITFLDTPGHAAFTAMRARGAHLTDIVILVVAADDGVMPQTIEAIDHAKAAETPIVVAINKSDLTAANPDRVKAELQKYELMAEDWGGKTIMVSVSALTGTGIEELLELLLLESEILELKANPNRLAQGTVVEGTLSKNLGVVATILVQNGTLRVGDILVCGQFYGRIRAMRNDRGKNIKEAGPSTPLEVLGLNGVPDSGERFYVVTDEKQARAITEKRFLEIKEKSLSGGVRHLSLEGLYDMMKEKGTKELKIILKADVQGSVEVLKQSLIKLSTDAIKVSVIHSGVGGINESDVVLAAASDAVIIGFHVKADSKAQSLIDREKVDMKYYKIIYEAIQDVKLAMEGLLEPTVSEKIVGTCEVQDTFKASKIGTIAGCIVRKGKMIRNASVRLIRDSIVVYDGKIGSLKRFKDDAREVLEGYECGIVLENFHDIKVGDIFECYVEEMIAGKL
jgi:translation initiation factor IF-2